MKRPVCSSLSLDKPQPVRSGSSSEQALQRSLPDGSESSLAPLFLLSKANPLRWALLWYRGDARLRPEWRQGIRKDRAANPVFSDLKLIDAADSFRQRRSRCHLPRGGRHNPSGAARHLPLHKGGMGAALSVSFAATSLGEGGTIPQSALRLTAPFAQGSLCTREPLRRGGGASRINFQAGGGCGVLRTSDRPAEGFLRRISH